MSLAERRNSDPSLLSLQYHANPVTLLEEEAGKRGCSPDTALKQLRLRPSLYKVQPERIPRPNDYRPDRVVTSNRARKAQLHIQFLKRLHLHQYPRSPLLNPDRIRN